MSRIDPQVNFRMPQELRGMLDAAAKESIERLLGAHDQDQQPASGSPDSPTVDRMALIKNLAIELSFP